MMIQHNDFLTNFVKAPEFANRFQNESWRSGKTLREGARRRVGWQNSPIFCHLGCAWLDHISCDVFVNGILRQQEVYAISQEPNAPRGYQFPDPLFWPTSLSSQLDFPQSKVAAILGIADKSYKNYELGKRELPLSIAAKFCEEFDQNLIWLLYGNSVPDSEQSARLAGETVQPIFEHADANDKPFSSAEIQKFTQYIFEQSLSKGTSPQSEAKLFFSAIG